MVDMRLTTFIKLANTVCEFMEQNKIEPGMKDIDKYIVCIQEPKPDGSIEVGFGKLK